MSFKNHIVTQTQSIITSSVGKHYIKGIIRLSVIFDPFGKMTVLRGLKNNQWECLCCNIVFQGINATKYIARVIGTRSMHINICLSSIYQDHLSRYK